MIKITLLVLVSLVALGIDILLGILVAYWWIYNITINSQGFIK